LKLVHVVVLLLREVGLNSRLGLGTFETLTDHVNSRQVHEQHTRKPWTPETAVIGRHRVLFCVLLAHRFLGKFSTFISQRAFQFHLAVLLPREAAEERVVFDGLHTFRP
jgi:hypothetical protein